jgi:hypothetical protein
MKKMKIIFLGLAVCFGTYNVIPYEKVVKDISLLSYQLMALGDDESSSGSEVNCYENISDTWFNAKSYYRCNSLVACQYVEGKNPQTKSTCYIN